MYTFRTQKIIPAGHKFVTLVGPIVSTRSIYTSQSSRMFHTLFSMKACINEQEFDFLPLSEYFSTYAPRAVPLRTVKNPRALHRVQKECMWIHADLPQSANEARAACTFYASTWENMKRHICWRSRRRIWVRLLLQFKWCWAGVFNFRSRVSLENMYEISADVDHLKTFSKCLMSFSFCTIIAWLQLKGADCRTGIAAACQMRRFDL